MVHRFLTPSPPWKSQETFFDNYNFKAKSKRETQLFQFLVNNNLAPE